MLTRVNLRRSDPTRYRRIIANGRTLQRRMRARMRGARPEYREMRFSTDNGRYQFTSAVAYVQATRRG